MVLGVLALEPKSPAWLGLVAYAPLLVAVRGARPTRALTLGWLAGAAIAGMGYRFLPDALARAAVTSEGAAWAALGGFAIYRGAVVGAACWIGAHVARRRGRGTLAAAAAFAGLELIVPSPLPFPFGVTIATSTELAQVADVGGPFGLTLLCVLVSAAVAELASRATDRVAAVIGAATLALSWGYGHARVAQIDAATKAAPTFVAHLVQPAQEPGRPASLSASLGGAPAGVQLVVLPESALPVSLPGEDLDPLLERLVETSAASPPILIGALASHNGTDTNSAFLVSPRAGVIGRYEKKELLPLAERDRWLSSWLGAAHGEDTAAGADLAPLAVDGVRLTPTICYESVVAEHVREEVLRTDGAVLVNLANDGWFRGSNEPELHLALARLRAIESRRPLLRASNDGVTAAIDAAGRELGRAPKGVATSITSAVPLVALDSPFRRVGTIPFGAAILALALVALARSPLPENFSRQDAKDAKI